MRIVATTDSLSIRSALLLAGLTAGLLAGCGHAPVSSLPPLAPASSPSAPLDTAPTTSLRDAVAADGTARFSVTIPHPSAARKADYISNATRSIRVAVKTINGLFPRKPIHAVVRLTAANRKACKSVRGALRCSFTLRAPAGKVQFAVSLYESTNARGAVLSSASVNAKLRPGKTTNVAMVPQGVAAKIVASVSALSALDDGATHSVTFSVSAEDASGATIIGPGAYAAPLQIGDTGDTQGALSFSPEQIPSPTSGSTPVTLTYDSLVPLTQAQIVISAQGATSATLTFSPMAISPATLNGFLLGSAFQTQTITISEAGYAGRFGLTGSNNAVAVTCTQQDCTPTSAGGPVQFTFTPQAAGSGAFAIADGLGTTAALPYRVSTFSTFPTIAHGGAVSNLIAGPDGNLWAVVQSGGTGTIVRSTTSGSVTSYPLPSPFNPTTSPDGVAGSDSAIWLVDGSTPYVYRVSTDPGSLGAVTSFATADGAAPTSIVLGSDKQTLYFTDAQGNLGSINAQTHATATYPYAYAFGYPSSSIAVSASGLLYFVNNGNVQSMTTAGAITMVGSPRLADGEYLNASLVVIGPDGSLWVGTPYGYLCNQQPDGTTIGCYPNALAQTISSLAVGPDGAIWASGATAAPRNALTRTVSGGATTTYAPNDCCAVENDLVIGSDGALWLASSTGGLDRIVP